MGFKFNPLIYSGFDIAGGAGASLAIGAPIGGGLPYRILETDGTGSLAQSSPLTNGQLVIGATGTAPVVANISGTTHQVTVTNAPGSITLSLPQDIDTVSSPSFAGLTVSNFTGVVHATSGVLSVSQVSLTTEVTGVLPIANGGTNLSSPGSANQLLSVTTTGGALEYRTVSTNTTGSDFNVSFTSGSISLNLPDASQTARGVVTTGAQTLTGIKTFSSLTNTDGGIDISTSGTLGIGTSANATVINIGNTGATINLIGSVVHENVTELDVSSPVFTVNTGGGIGSAASSGLQVDEASVVTGYILTSSDRSSWLLKAPGQTGIATINAGTAGITLNQSSHNPITINATANGLSVDGSQVLTLGLASAGAIGALSSTDWSTFNAKQPAGNYITALTGDVVAAGPGSVASTIQPGVVTDAKIAAAAGILVNKLQALTVSSPVRTDSSGFLTVGDIALASADVSGVLPVANGGTSSGATLLNNRLMISSSGAIVEAPTLADGQLFIGSASSAPQAANLTAGTGITIISSPGSITISATDSDVGDIAEATHISTVDVPVNESVGTLFFNPATIRSFKAQVSVFINATSNIYSAYDLVGIQNDSGWYLSQSSVGDDQLIVFNITSGGQVQYSKQTTPGFNSSLFHFRATVLSV